MTRTPQSQVRSDGERRGPVTRAENFAAIIPAPLLSDRVDLLADGIVALMRQGMALMLGAPVSELAPWDARMIDVKRIDDEMVRVRMVPAETLRRLLPALLIGQGGEPEPEEWQRGVRGRIIEGEDVEIARCLMGDASEVRRYRSDGWDPVGGVWMWRLAAVLDGAWWRPSMSS